MDRTNQYQDHQYPLLAQVSELYDDVDMSDVLVLACQHLLEPQLHMFRSFLACGLKPANCLIAGKCYSTNHEVLAELCALGFEVAPFSNRFDPVVDFEGSYKILLENWIINVLKEYNLQKIRRIIVLDDGGHMHEAVSRVFRTCNKYIVGIEQTSSGKARIERLGIRFTRHMVASNEFKQREEAPFIGALGAERIGSCLKTHTIASPKILVFGLGTIGRHTAAQLYLKNGLNVWVTDQNYGDPVRKLSDERVCQMFASRSLLLEHADALSRLGEFDVIVGATGSQVLTAKQIMERSHPYAMFISMSSGDIEFPAYMFRRDSHGVHRDYMVGNRRLANAGFPITFMGNRHELHPLKIELTIAMLQASVMDLACRYGQGPRYGMTIHKVHRHWRELLVEQELVSA